MKKAHAGAKVSEGRGALKQSEGWYERTIAVLTGAGRLEVFQLRGVDKRPLEEALEEYCEGIGIRLADAQWSEITSGRVELSTGIRFSWE